MSQKNPGDSHSFYSGRFIAVRSIAVLMAAMLLFAAWSKTSNVHEFMDTIRGLLGHPVLGGFDVGYLHPVVRAVAVLVIASEAAIGLMLLFFSNSRLVFIFAAAVLGIFSIALLGLVTLPEAVPCGCFGELLVESSTPLKQTAVGIFRNAGLIVLAVWSSEQIIHGVSKHSEKIYASWSH